MAALSGMVEGLAAGGAASRTGCFCGHPVRPNAKIANDAATAEGPIHRRAGVAATDGVLGDAPVCAAAAFLFGNFRVFNVAMIRNLLQLVRECS